VGDAHGKPFGPDLGCGDRDAPVLRRQSAALLELGPRPTKRFHFRRGPTDAQSLSLDLQTVSTLPPALNNELVSDPAGSENEDFFGFRRGLLDCFCTHAGIESLISIKENTQR
jgi:hypothetical protein